MFDLSLQQQDIVEMAKSGVSFSVIARAGTGKTSTALAICKVITGKILVVSFSNKIVNDIKAKIVMDNVTVSTIHTAGNSIIKLSGMRPRIDNNKISDIVGRYRLQNDFKKLVDYLRGNCIEVASCKMVQDAADLLELKMEVNSTNIFLITRNVNTIIAESDRLAEQGHIDFVDMLKLSTKMLNDGLITADFDTVIVDEAQDCSELQIDFLRALNAKQYILTFDDRQRIFGFAQAVDDFRQVALDVFGSVYELPLTVSFRCSKAVARAASKIVYDFSAFEKNPLGEVNCSVSDISPKTNFVLARTNKLVVEEFVRFVKRGYRARLEGVDVIKMIQEPFEWAIKNNASLSDWLSDNVIKIEKSKKDDWIKVRLIEALRDKFDLADTVETLFLSENGNVEATYNKAKAFFATSNSKGDAVVLFMTIHKSKGLEADHVTIIDSVWRDNQMDKENLAYVALTRAKHTVEILQTNENCTLVNLIR